MNRRQTLQGGLFALTAWGPVASAMEAAWPKRESSGQNDYLIIDPRLYDELQRKGLKQGDVADESLLTISGFEGTVLRLSEERCIVRTWSIIQQRRQALAGKTAIHGLTLPSDFTLAGILIKEDGLKNISSQPLRLDRANYVLWQAS